jgi:hypothetical protein
MRRCIVLLCSAIGLMIVSAPLVCAQDTGTIHGRILDPTNAAVPGTTVQAVNEETGFAREAVSNEEGEFFIRALPPGKYKIAATLTGFKAYTQTGLQVSVNQNTRADVQLEVGGVEDSVTVQSTTFGVDTRGSTVGGTIDRERIENLPLLNRNVLSLATLLPGVGPTNVPTTVTGSRGGPNVSVSGSRVNDNNIMLDGTSLVAGLYNTAQNLPSPDSIQEFRVLTNTYSAEFGRGAGSVFLAVTKSGTNAFRGNAFEYFRDDALNARNAFATTKPFLRQNQFGGSLGGPVLLPGYDGRNKTFFFTSFQGLRIDSQSLMRTFPVTDLEREGNFSASSTTIRDPLTGQPFPGNIIPASRIDPLSANLFKEYMKLSPNQPDGSNLTLQTFSTTTDQLTIKGDHHFSSANSLSVRYYLNADRRQETTPVDLLPLVSAGAKLPVQSITISDTHIVTPSIVNEFRVSYLRVPSRGAGARVEQKTARELGGKFNQNSRLPLVPVATISGRFGIAPGAPSRVDVDNTYQAENKLSWMRGRHAMKFGFSVYYARQLTESEFRTSGNFTFDGSFTGVPMADYMLGKPSSMTISNPYYTALTGSDYAAYAQDDFKVSSNWTLNYGVRYQLHVPWTNKFGYASNVVPGSQSTYIPNAPPGLVYYGDPNIPAGLYKTDKTRFEPRLGLVWDVFGNGRTALRAGYGLYTGSIGGIMVQHAYEMPPFQRVLSLSPPTSFSDPYAGGPDPFPYTVDIENPIFAYPIQAFLVDPDFKDSYTQQFNANVQQQIASDLVIQVGYVGKVAQHLPQAIEWNAAVYGPGATIANAQQRRPYFPQYFAGIAAVRSVGNSTYHSLQVSAQKRFTHGYTIDVAYTLSKSVDEGSLHNAEGSSVSNPWDYRGGERGLSDFDRRHILAVSGVWNLPGFNNNNSVVSRLIGGWQLSGSLYKASGSPFSVITGADTALLGGSRGLGNQRANVTGDPVLDHGRPRQELIAQYFNTKAFTSPALGSFGNSARNLLIGPGSFTTNLALVKDFRLSSAENLGKIQFRAEAFNLLNWVNLGNPANSLTSPNFGRITSAGDARIIQLGLRYDF